MLKYAGEAGSTNGIQTSEYVPVAERNCAVFQLRKMKKAKRYIVSNKKHKSVEEIRNEAINEFSEKLQKYYNSIHGITYGALVAYHIQEKAREMTEKDKGGA